LVWFQKRIKKIVIKNKSIDDNFVKTSTKIKGIMNINKNKIIIMGGCVYTLTLLILFLDSKM
jgi:hypothetical protein